MYTVFLPYALIFSSFSICILNDPKSMWTFQATNTLYVLLFANHAHM